MKKVSQDSLYVAIDIGTTKICVLIAHNNNDFCEIIGIGKAPSHGLARGIVVDIAAAVDSIKIAVREAEFMAGYSVDSAYIGISGSHIQSINSRGMVAIKQGQVRDYDIAHVIAAAKAVTIPEGQQVLHVIPQFYIIDGNHHVQDPLGMHGIRLETQVHIITGNVSSVQNLIRCCEAAGIKVRDIILEPLASADAVIGSDEINLGVGMLDIGGGTSDFAVYHRGTIRHTKIFPIAGNLFTQDIAHCLRTTFTQAEAIKHAYGMQPLNTHIENPIEQYIEIDTLHHEHRQVVFLQDLITILAYRSQELLLLVNAEIKQYHLDVYMASGFILTGGGSLLTGLVTMAQDILACPVRIGKPKIPAAFKESLNNPMYATAYGLLVHALKKNKNKRMEQLSGPMINRVFSRMKSWVFDFF
ncbi:MAG: cell division protein FtsA [Candidatus Babeliaceae bacterium]|jgi:cell division protein FtsA